MTQHMQNIDRYMEENLDASIAELSKLSAQPSVAAQNWGMQECAALVGELLKARGFTVEIMPTPGRRSSMPNARAKATAPCCSTTIMTSSRPSRWSCGSRRPSSRPCGMACFSRAASAMTRVTSPAACSPSTPCWRQTGELPCNIKFVIEGEEEVSSVNLHDFIRQHKEKLSADACIWEFGGVNHDEVPMQYLGLRGICYVELSVQTAIIDAHSGIGGSIFPNAAWRLVWALNSLKGPDERIRVPGHYDDIIPPTARDRELMAQLSPVVEEYTTRYGVSSFLKGTTDEVELKMQEVFEPTCTICGLTSGYQGPGSKTVLPAVASAKVDFRLVPGQTPEKVLENLRRHLDAEGFEDVQIKFLGGEPAARTDPDHPFVKLVVDAAADVYEHPMQLVPMIGGSGPNYPFIHDLNLPVATAGVGYPGSQAHAPNENVRLDLYLAGAKHIARIIRAFAA
jgi:acetylornithine deacetylase/succinyl-diaminopimelate desuccinylase-like protein